MPKDNLPHTGTIGWVLTRPDEPVILLGKVVTAKFTDDGGFFYIEEDDRSAGIRVNSSANVSPGDRVNVEGALSATNLGGTRIERCIINATVTQATPSSGNIPPPIGMDNLNIGGSDINDYTPGINRIDCEPGLALGDGPYNKGLLIRAWGYVKSVDSNNRYFYVDDGSRLSDGTAGTTGIRVQACDDRSLPQTGMYVTVTGVSSCFPVSSGGNTFIRPVIKIRDGVGFPDDIVEETVVAIDDPQGTIGAPLEGQTHCANLVALPGVPYGGSSYPAANVIFDDTASACQDGSLNGSLCRWDTTPPQSYPDSLLPYFDDPEYPAFGSIYSGQGYWIQTVQAGTISYSGVLGSTQLADRYIKLPYCANTNDPDGGLTLVGYPFTSDRPFADAHVTDGIVTLTMREAIESDWIEENVYWWKNTEPPSSARKSVSISGSTPDDANLRPWRGYWIRSFKPKLAIVIPRPRPDDTSRPSVTINQASGQDDPAYALPVNFTVEFSEPVLGFTSNDIVIGGSAGGSKTVTLTRTTDTIYNVAVSGITVSGTVIASIPAYVSYDAANNGNLASQSTDNSVLYVTGSDPLPTITITSPKDQSIVNKAAGASGIPVSGAVAGGTADLTVEVLNGAAWQQAELIGTSWDFANLPVSEGTQTIQARVTDSIGHTAIAQITVTVVEKPVIFVDHDSAYNGPGNDWDHAFHSVQSGLDAANAEDCEVWVAEFREGAYYELVTLRNGVGLYGGFYGNESYREQRNWNVYITSLEGSGSYGSYTVTSPTGADETTVISGFAIQHSMGVLGGGILCNSSSPTICNNRITQNNATSGSAILCDGGAARIVGNWIIANQTDTGGALECSNSAHPLIVNNTFASNTGEGGSISCDGSSSPVLSNNIVALNASGIYAATGAGPVLSNNCVFSNTAFNYQGLSAGTGDISQDPMLEDIPNGDYHINGFSPCVDSGDDTRAQIGLLDIDGENWQGDVPDRGTSLVDIGADEWLPGSRAASAPRFFPDGDTYDVFTMGVTITSATPGAVIRYTVNGQVPTETSTLYDPEGVVVIPHDLTLKARAFKDGLAPSSVKSAHYSVFDNCSYGSDYAYQYQSSSVIQAPPVRHLQLTDIYAQTTARIDWNFNLGATYEVERRVNEVGTQLADGIVDRFFVDTGCPFNSTCEYAVRVVGGGNDDKGLPAPPPEGTTAPVWGHVTWLPAEDWSTISVSPVEVVAAENETVDSRLDMREANEVFLDYKFKNKTYRGGLFAGFAYDPSRVGRSYFKFNLQDLPEGQRLWSAGGLSAYYTRSFVSGSTEVGVYPVTDDSWSPQTLNWSTAPAYNTNDLRDTAAVSYDSELPVDQSSRWCKWRMIEDIESQLNGDHVLSMALASKYETMNGWAYFAKKEFDSALAPKVVYAGGAPVLVLSLTLNKYTLKGGETVIGTVTINELAPAGGCEIPIRTFDGCTSYVLAPDSITIGQGFNVGTFVISTHVLSNEYQPIAAGITAGIAYPQTATLTITP